MWSNFCLCSMIQAVALSTFCRGWTLAVLTRVDTSVADDGVDASETERLFTSPY